VYCWIRQIGEFEIEVKWF